MLKDVRVIVFAMIFIFSFSLFFLSGKTFASSSYEIPINSLTQSEGSVTFDDSGKVVQASDPSLLPENSMIEPRGELWIKYV
ncbi:hypothetical protein FHQ08_09650 [Lactobacillus sp. CC-MHH1034]|uniref:hypothetical protein n=1 Tax=Agrilactobacillus fermenti TaxID=2586909 RepID=UPI001E2B5E5F|nr:hypothetical protein [Agrilactobacillus fermenti]MCD2256987.1 hypothetical protein [Agrilactobacillus fermenti]